METVEIGLERLVVTYSEIVRELLLLKETERDKQTPHANSFHTYNTITINVHPHTHSVYTSVCMCMRVCVILPLLVESSHY